MLARHPSLFAAARGPPHPAEAIRNRPPSRTSWIASVTGGLPFTDAATVTVAACPRTTTLRIFTRGSRRPPADCASVVGQRAPPAAARALLE